MKADMDKELFAELFSKYTKVGKTTILKSLENHKVNDLLQNPSLVTNDLTKITRINELKLLRNTYDNLKDYNKNYTISSPEKAKDFFINKNMDIQDKEYFSIAFLDTKNQVIEVKTIEGALNYAMVSTREVIKEALKYNAANILISHNHPSGSPIASKDDLDLTGRLYNACEIVGVSLLDHIITANYNHYSVKEHHVMSNLSGGSRVIESKSDYTLENKKASIKDKLEAAKNKSIKKTKSEIKNVER